MTYHRETAVRWGLRLSVNPAALMNSARARALERGSLREEERKTNTLTEAAGEK